MRRPEEEPARAAVISVRGLRKEYQGSGGAVVALDDIEFAVSEGEFVAILGPSGCGKSTLLKIVAGLLPCTRGEVRLRDLPVQGPRHDVGVVFQSPVLFPWRTVLDNVLLPIEVQGLGRAKHRAHAMELLALVGLRGFEGRYPWELSGGAPARCAAIPDSSSRG
jgi:NitT/TauT family transport system ATP-binding protein